MITLLERFEDKYIPEPMSGCWLWLGALSPDGYGSIKIRSIRNLAHRMSYELNVGDIPAGKCVRHTCDTPSCVNPNHLETGTWGDNNRDRARRKRSRDRWNGRCKNGHDMDTHGYHRSAGTRYCATCAGIQPRPKNGAWL